MVDKAKVSEALHEMEAAAVAEGHAVEDFWNAVFEISTEKSADTEAPGETAPPADDQPGVGMEAPPADVQIEGQVTPPVGEGDTGVE